MRVISLFSGCGGMDIGFEGGFICHKKSVNTKIHPTWITNSDKQWVTVAKTGFDIVFANDIRPDAKAAWLSYFKNRIANAEEKYHLGSIVDLVKQAKNGKKIFPENIDIVIGGFPCQDFSIAGKRRGFNSLKNHNGEDLEAEEPSIESRGQLYIWMRDVITLTLPKIFIAENVKGLTNLKDVKDIIEKDFSKAGKNGYLVIPAKILYAPSYGVPQSRERVIFFGFRKDALKKRALDALTQDVISEKYNPYPPKTHSSEPDVDKNLIPFVTCEDILCDLPEPEYSTDLSHQKYSKAKYMGSHCQGQTEIKLDSVGPTIRAEHHGNIEFRRLSAEHGGTHTEELTSGRKERRLSVRECARIQTFPNDYEFVGNGVNSSDAYKIVGNAVPCILAYSIAKNIEDKWNLYFKK